MDETENNVPNLDAMDRQELWEFADSIDRTPITKARELFPQRQQGHLRATLDLSKYAWNRLAATALREDGKIEQALVYEQNADRIYWQLPEFARW